MVIVRQRSVLAGLRVREVMRRRVTRLPGKATLSHCINQLVKNKISALLVIDGEEHPIGVVSKTDLIGAFYAGLPLDTRIDQIAAGEPLFRLPDDSLESAIDLMHGKGVHRLYVMGADGGRIVGKLAYPDIVALLYRYCRACPNSSATGRRSATAAADAQRLRVSEVMTAGVLSCPLQTSLAEVVEQLTARRFGAVVVTDAADVPQGVLSKSDLVLAYKHGLGINHPATAVMQTPVLSCGRDDLLTTALRQMLLKDVQRLFVHQGQPPRMVGVLSLSDSVRYRSGSCRACISGRLIAGE
jgi:CBS domain-containing protein